MSDPAFVEYKHVRQEPGRRRRWFQSPAGDLMVWYDPADDSVSGLQFCHLESVRERVYTWRPGGGWSQQVVDEGSRPPMMKATPILVGTAPVPLGEMRRRVRSALPGLEPDLAAFVAKALENTGSVQGDDSASADN